MFHPRAPYLSEKVSDNSFVNSYHIKEFLDDLGSYHRFIFSYYNLSYFSDRNAYSCPNLYFKLLVTIRDAIS